MERVVIKRKSKDHQSLSLSDCTRIENECCSLHLTLTITIISNATAAAAVRLSYTIQCIEYTNTMFPQFLLSLIRTFVLSSSVDLTVFVSVVAFSHFIRCKHPLSGRMCIKTKVAMPSKCECAALQAAVAVMPPHTFV